MRTRQTSFPSKVGLDTSHRFDKQLDRVSCLGVNNYFTVESPGMFTKTQKNKKGPFSFNHDLEST